MNRRSFHRQRRLAENLGQGRMGMDGMADFPGSGIQQFGQSRFGNQIRRVGTDDVNARAGPPFSDRQ